MLQIIQQRLLFGQLNKFESYEKPSSDGFFFAFKIESSTFVKISFMKKFIFSFALIVSTMVLLNSCNKYPDGPKFTILTKTARLCNNWELVSILKDGNEVISKVPAKTLSIDKDGTFSMADSQTALGQITTTYIHGDWTLDGEKTTLSLLQNGLDIPVTYTIKELKNKTLVLEQYTSQGIYLMTFQPQNN